MNEVNMLITPEMVQSARLRIARERGDVPVVLIEEEYTLTDSVIEQLQGFLSELEQMPVPPPAGSPEAIASHDEWMTTRKRIRRIVERAEWRALLTVPPEVAEVLNAINARKNVLFNLPSA